MKRVGRQEVRQKRLRAGFCLAIILALCSYVRAAELPRYDAEAYCHNVASASPYYSAILKGACLDKEQESYDAIKLNWSTFPEQARSYCDRVATVSGNGSYTMLKACIEEEMELGSSTRKFRY